MHKCNEVTFYLNGKEVTIENPSPDLLLIDYLRSPGVGLTGSKKACGQGGCGACTVILSSWNASEGQPKHCAINSCLRPVCALGGLVVTTIEGTGAVRRPNPSFLNHSATISRHAAPLDMPPSAIIEAPKEAQRKREKVQSDVRAALEKLDRIPKMKLKEARASHPSSESHDGMNPIAHRLALNNGSQCGYCSVGFVMNMSEFIVNNRTATKHEIEDIFDGNICRCTGYRPILTGMKTFASDWSKEDEKNRMQCKCDDGSESQLPADVVIPFPDKAQRPAVPVSVVYRNRTWHAPDTLSELVQIMERNRAKKLRLVHGNTSYGIYKEECHEAEVLVDIRLVTDLYCEPKIQKGELHVGAGITYSELIRVLESQMQALRVGITSRLGAIHFMARRTAGRIVRNAASIGGNTMLVLKHISGGTGEPFPSDILTALAAVEARIVYVDLVGGEQSKLQTSTVDELVQRVRGNADFADNIVLIRYQLPCGEPREMILPQKVAQRDVNAHSIVNATTRFQLSDDTVVEKAVLAFGGIAPFPWRAKETEQAMVGRKLSLNDVPKLAELLRKEVLSELERWAERMRGLPSEGFTNEYRVQLAVSFLYKALVNAILKQPDAVPRKIRSSGMITWGQWPVSDGKQSFATQLFKQPVSQPYIKLSSMYQASGQVHYTQELPMPPLTVNAAFVQSRRALAKYFFVIPGDNNAVGSAELRDHLTDYSSSFVDLITHEHIKDSGINYQGMGFDQPLFAERLVSYVGQSIALVLADTEQEAIRIADYVTRYCVGYGPADWPAPWNEPVLSLEQALKLGSVFPDSPSTAIYLSHIWKITRPGSRFDWTTPDKDALDRNIVNRMGLVDGISCQIVENTQSTGGQIHFYLETQGCIAEPADEWRLIVRPSTQSPMEMHQTIAMALGVEYHRIEVRVPPVGGAFGGKTEQSRFVVGPVAVAAHACKKPIRLAMPREEDTSMIGKRHAYYGQYQIAVDRGEIRPEDKGIIRGLQTKMWGDGGAFYDCSFIVANCIQLRADNAYRVRNFGNQIDVCRTNKAPSTACRGFGDIQAKVILENAVDDAAFSVGMLPEELREKNLYQRGDVTPFGEALSECYIKEVWSFLKKKCDYDEKRRRVDEFNKQNKWRKRGLGMIPVKYGCGYNLAQLEQAAAIIAVNQGDGTVLVHQGGVEMGQGLLTQIQQITSYVLNVPLELIRVESANTIVTPNPTSTGACTGTAYNGEAVKQACEQLRARLTDFGYQMLKDRGNDWCEKAGIDFWNHGEKGWAARTGPNKTLIWQKLVQLAHANRVSLISSFTAKIQGGTTPVPAMTYKPQNQQPDIPGIERDKEVNVGGAVDSFIGFTYSAACSVVELDVLTGEVKLLTSDIVYDAGWSLNPAIDIGQVEGAFVQGIGYLLMENLVFEEDGPEKGRLNTLNTWRYKPPAFTNIPLEMNVYLFPRDIVAGIPENPNDIFSAKEVGEPPLVLATSVFFALKAAVRESRLERKLSGLFRLDSPATVQEVRRVCEVSISDFGASAEDIQ